MNYSMTFRPISGFPRLENESIRTYLNRYFEKTSIAPRGKDTVRLFARMTGCSTTTVELALKDVGVKIFYEDQPMNLALISNLSTVEQCTFKNDPFEQKEMKNAFFGPHNDPEAYQEGVTGKMSQVANVQNIDALAFTPFTVQFKIMDNDQAAAFREMIDSVDLFKCSRNLNELVNSIKAQLTEKQGMNWNQKS